MSEGPSDKPQARYELDVMRQAKLMRDEELIDFIRDTVTRLEVLADRLEAKVGGKAESSEQY